MDNDYVVIVDGDLYHHGIIGMKWGRRRYQNKDGSLTAAGKKRYAAEMEKVQAETKKIKAEQRTKARTAAKLSKLEQAKQELKELKTGKKAETPETPEEIKARIRKNPNPEDVYKHRNLFTDTEIQNLSTRFTNEKNIKDKIPEKIDPRKEKINKIVDEIGYLTDKAVVVTKGYNMVANVLNAFGVTDLPKISTDIDGKGNQNNNGGKPKNNDNDGGKPKNKTKGDNKPDSDTDNSADDQAKAEARQAKKDAKAEARQAKREEKAEARQAKREEKAEARREKAQQQQARRYAEANELAQQLAKERDEARSSYINKRREEIWNDYANSQQRLSQAGSSSAARLGQQYANRTLSLGAPGNGTRYTFSSYETRRR